MVEAEVVKERGKPPFRVTSLEAMCSVSFTCDAPICRDHGKVFGFVSGQEPDFIDFCAGCQDKIEGHGVMSSLEIQETRKRWHNEYRKRRLFLVD